MSPDTDNAPVSPPPADDASAPPTAADRSRSRRIINTLSDWLALLSGPPSPVFTEIVEKEDWGRLLKLLALVLLLSGVILGVAVGISTSLAGLADIVLVSKPAAVALIVGAMLGVFYSGIAAIFGVKISLSNAFFVVLSIGLPWLPFIAILEAMKTMDYELMGIIFLLSHLVLIKPLVNFYFGVITVTRSAKWRVLLSILIPLLSVGSLIIYVLV